MHASSRKRMEKFAQMCAKMYGSKTQVSILDVGGLDVSYSDIFKRYMPNAHYFMLNVDSGWSGEEAPNTIIVKKFYEWSELQDNEFDLVISGSTLEHIEYPWLTFLEMRRVLKNYGWLCVITHSHWPLHRFPLDTYRYYADGLDALAKFAGLTTLYSGADHFPAKDGRQKGDSYIVAQKFDKYPEEAATKYANAQKACLAITPDLDSYDVASQCELNILSGNFTGDYSIHTSNEQFASLIIVLQHKIFVEKLILFNRMGLEDRAVDLGIYCSSDMVNWTKILDKTGEFGGIYDAQPLRVAVNRAAKYILIRQNERGFIHLDQVKIISSLKKSLELKK